jgi:phage terminase large subunit
MSESKTVTVAIRPPNPKQRQFLAAKQRYVAFGGARGGGKSWAVRTKATLLALGRGGIRILILRRTLPELESNHIRFLRDQLAGAAVYNASQRQFAFPNGSVIDFGYCDCDSDLDRYQGAEYDVIFVDEATQFREEWLRRLGACVRGVNGFPKRTYYTCNPGGPGHGYIKRLFIDRHFERGEDPADYLFIPAKVTDNTALMRAQPEYLRTLEALPARLRRAWLEGKWDVFEGQVFQEFTDDPDHYADRRFTHVIEPFDIPRSWNVYRSYDFGYAKPFSCAWWAVDYDGVVYRILELYGCTETPDEGVRWSPDRQFAEIRRLEDTHPWLKGRSIRGVADPAIWDASRGESIYETALKYRIYFQRGDNRRIPGWMQLHYRMAFDENGYPMLYVFRNCRAFLRTVPALTYDRTAPEDVDTAQEDHAADEARYFCMSRPIPPRRRQEEARPADDPLELLGKR